MKPVLEEYDEPVSPVKVSREPSDQLEENGKDLEIEVDNTYQQLYAEQVRRPSVISESLYSMMPQGTGASGQTISLSIYFFETTD